MTDVREDVDGICSLAAKSNGSSSVELTILMPCLNEAETLANCIRKAKQFLAQSGIDGEIVVADNGSTDGSQSIAERLGARVVPVGQRGYGAALSGGIEMARGRFIIMGDSDDSYNFADLDGFIRELRAGADLVMGNRFRGGIAPGAMPFLHRYLGNPVLSFLGRLFFRISIGDFHCGLRAFRRDRIRALDLHTTGMEFASEMVVKSALANVDIREVPTTLSKDGRSKPPHLRTWRDGWRHLKFLLMYSPRWLFIYPGLISVALGALIAAVLFHGMTPFLGTILLDLNSFVTGCFMIVLGVQLITFGVLSRVYAAAAGLLPPSSRSFRYAASINLDKTVAVSVALLIIGIATFAFAFKTWAQVEFGPLVDPMVPRIVILGLTIIVNAFQMFFAAFFLGILRIPTNHKSPCQSML